jgi:hypothetical protein
MKVKCCNNYIFPLSREADSQFFNPRLKMSQVHWYIKMLFSIVETFENFFSSVM